VTRFLRLVPALALIALAGVRLAAADQPIPPLRSPVTDTIGLLTTEQASALETKLRAFETRKGAQVAVLIVGTTAPEAIEQYARRVLDSWKLGRKGIDDGALLLVALDDHRVRIETQYGLEGVLPDVIASRIIRETITPRFKAQDYYGGINDGIDRMLGVIDGEPLPPPAPDWQGPGWESSLPILLIVALATGAALRAIFGRFFGSLASGAATGVVAWFIAGLMPVALGAALIAFVLALIGSTGPGRWVNGALGGGWGGGGGWSGGGGGWSGGGGGGGGGGASGSW